MMNDHGITNKKISRKVLVQKIEQNVTNFIITEAKCGGKPAVIHSKEAGRSALDKTLEDMEWDMKTIFHCSKIIREAVLQFRRNNPWFFYGSLVGCSETGVPVELISLTRWILHGTKAATTETRTKDLHKSCNYNPLKFNNAGL